MFAPTRCRVGCQFLTCSLRQVLCSWLSNSPNYEEITKWYLGWKSMFSDQVLAHPSIKDKFNEALDIMNRAVSSNVGEWGFREGPSWRWAPCSAHKDITESSGPGGSRPHS